ncbi:hypothetical protein Tco_0814721 [Tanacetum coccineum]
MYKAGICSDTPLLRRTRCSVSGSEFAYFCERDQTGLLGGVSGERLRWRAGQGGGEACSSSLNSGLEWGAGRDVGETILSGGHLVARTTRSHSWSGDGKVVIMEYLVKPIRRIQDFDELKDRCLTLKNTPYPHQRYAVYSTLVNKEEPTDFTSIRRIHQEDTAYPCLHFTDNHQEFKSNTPYPGTSIRCIQSLLYAKILKDIKHGPYSKKAQYAVSHIARYGVSNRLPDTINRLPKTQF